MVSISLLPEFGYVILTVAAGVILTQWQAFQVGAQRKKCGLKYPKMYEDKDNSVFNCYQRAHQNTLEFYPSFLVLLLLSGVTYPVISSILGLIWIVGRVFYSLGYYTGDPKKRMRGAWGTLGLVGLLITTIVSGVQFAFSS